MNESYNRSVICHIIGINPMTKDNFIKSLEEYNILDLEKFSSIIVSRKKYRRLRKKKDKTKLGHYWKQEMNKKVNTYLKKHKNNNIVMIIILDYLFQQ
jgi:preprotein translocase subunit Sec63